jgi:competence protein ComEA
MIRKSIGPKLAALTLGAALAGALAAPAVLAAANEAKAPAAASAASPVNVNTATIEELTALPGIGEKRAQAIVEARKQKGGFKSVDELTEVKGIGPANLEKLRPYLRAGASPTP